MEFYKNLSVLNGGTARPTKENTRTRHYKDHRLIVSL